MTKQPLKEYLEKLVAYNKTHAVSTIFTYTKSFTDKYELIKRIKHVSIYHEYKFYDNIKRIFNRYMKNSDWHW